MNNGEPIPRGALALIVVLLLVTAVGLWLYLAGGIFLMTQKRPFEEATLLTYAQYWQHYGHEAVTRKWLWVATAGATVALFAPLLVFFSPAKQSLYGDARFAKAREVKKAGLFSNRGIIVGKFKGRYLIFGGSQHALMSAPTRSGKGVSVVIPNLLTWTDSAVTLDIKQENHALTSAYRARYGQAVYLFNPGATDYRTHRYNPLAYINDDEAFQIDDIQKIAGMLFPDVPGTDVIWTATPRSLFLGVVLLLRETPGKLVTMGQVLRESLADGDGSKYFASIIATRRLGELIKCAQPEAARQQATKDLLVVLADKAKAPQQHPRIAEMAVWAHLSTDYREAIEVGLRQRRAAGDQVPDLLEVLQCTEFDKGAAELGKALSPACVQGLNSYVTISSDNTRSGIMTSFRSRLELWNNPIVDAATSGNDFDLREVRKRRMSIYVGISPDNLARFAPLINLFFQQLIDLNTRELPEFNPELKHQCLIVADEFTAMGKVECLSNGISFIAGYGLRLLPIIQSPAQLVHVYGENAAETFKTNHGLQIVFPPKANETKVARDISEWLGYQTVRGRSLSKSASPFSKRERSETESDQRRALMLPQEITGLQSHQELVVTEGCPPIMATKARYYSDPVFMDRLKEVSPSLAALGKRLPSHDQIKAAMRGGEMAAPVPLIDLKAHAAAIHGATSAITPQPKDELTEVIRPVVADDIPELASLSLDAFVIDFSGVKPPPKGALDLEALERYADALCERAGIRVQAEQPMRAAA